MSCTVNFTINGIVYKIGDLPLDDYMAQRAKEGKSTHIDTVDDLMKVVSLLDPTALKHFSSTLLAENKAKTETKYTYTAAVPLNDLIGNPLPPNQNNIDVINLLNERGTNTSPLASFITRTLSDDGREISFLSQPIRTTNGGTAQGFFDNTTGHIYIHVGEKESINSPEKIELLSHELIHKYLSDGIYKDGKIRDLLLNGYDLIKAKWGKGGKQLETAYPAMNGVLKAIARKEGDSKLEEILAYALTNSDFQKFANDVEKGQPIPILDALIKEVQNRQGSVQSLNNVFQRYSNNEVREEPVSMQQYLDKGINDGSIIEIKTPGMFPIDPKIKEGESFYIRNIDPSYALLVTIDKVTPSEITATSYNGDSITLKEGDFLESTNSPFGHESTASLVRATIDPERYDRTGYVEQSNKVRDRFIDNTKELQQTDKYHKFNTNYSKTYEMSETSSDVQLQRLRQNDLVLLPMSLRFDKSSKSWEHVEPTEKKFAGSSFRPIIKTFRKNGVMMVRVPSADGANNYDIEGKYVTGYRYYEGDLKEQHHDPKLVKTAFDKLISYYPDPETGMDPESVLRSFKSKYKNENGDEESYEKFIPSNKNSMGFAFTNGEAAQTLFDGIVTGDVVKVLFTSKNKKYSPFRGIVLRKLANSLEIVSTAGKVQYVGLNDLREIIYQNENHPEFKALLDKEGKTVDVKSYFYVEDTAGEKTINNMFKTEYLDQYNPETNTSQTKDYYSFGPKPLTQTQATKDAFKEVLGRRRRLIENLKTGDLIKVAWNIKDKVTKIAKPVSGWYPVIATTANTVYFYGKEGNIMHVNISKSFGDESSLAAIAHNNISEAKLFDAFDVKKKKYQEIFDDKDYRSENRIKALKAKESTELQEEYYLTEYSDYDPNNSGELKDAVSKLTRGDILKGKVFTDKSGKDIEKWHVITDVNEEGLPLCVTFTGSYNKQFTSGKEFTTKPGYKVYPIQLENIRALGINIKPDAENEVHGNQDMLDTIKNYQEKFKAFKTPKFFTPEEATTAGFAKVRQVKDAIYGEKNGKATWAVSEKYLDKVYDKLPEGVTQMKYAVEKNGKFYTEGQSGYDELWYPYRVKGKIHDSLKVGDIITETWDYQGKKIYMDGIIIKKNKGSLNILRFDNKEESKMLTFSNATVLRKFPKAGEEAVVEYPGINAIKFEKKGRGMKGTKQLIDSLKTSREDSPTTPEATTQPKPRKASARFSRETTAFTKSRDGSAKIEQVSDLLKSMYDVDIELLRSDEIAERFNSTVEGTPSKERAFISDGKIYINLDLASSAEPLHEMAHLVLSSIKSRNLDLYKEMIASVESHPDYDNIAKSYPGRPKDTLDEEVFATLFGEHYRGNLDKNKYTKQWNDENTGLFQKILNFVKKIFSDTFNSPKILDYSDKDFMNLSLDQLLNRFGDNLLEGKFNHALHQYDNVVSRKIKNLHAELMKDETLTSICFK